MTLHNREVPLHRGRLEEAARCELTLTSLARETRWDKHQIIGSNKLKLAVWLRKQIGRSSSLIGGNTYVESDSGLWNAVQRRFGERWRWVGTTRHFDQLSQEVYCEREWTTSWRICWASVTKGRTASELLYIESSLQINFTCPKMGQAARNFCLPTKCKQLSKFTHPRVH